jgi:putative DNA primase/helicase
MALRLHPCIHGVLSSTAQDASSLATGRQSPEVTTASVTMEERGAPSKYQTDPNGTGATDARSDSRQEQVLRLAKRGLKLFPIAANDKVPLKGFKWKELATDDDKQIKQWFVEFPKCNWAACTGAASKVFVLDVDGVAGRTSLSALSQASLPPTLITHTGKELGHHFWFEYPADMVIHNSAHKLGPGLDIRGEDGYVVVPPSIHPNGSIYKFGDEGEEISSAPEWLLEAITDTRQTERDYLCAETGRPIPVGARNDTLFRDGCAMRRRGATEEEIIAFIKQANLRCEQGLPESELRKIAHSGLQISSDTRC